MNIDFRIGQGFDVHAFGDGDHVMLGGVRVPHARGVLAHSDGDVVLHALCDAILGALALGDIGKHFPPSDARWKGADSRAFVRHCDALIREHGWKVGNCDYALAVALCISREALVNGMVSSVSKDLTYSN